jgi:hypothetical protein
MIKTAATRRFILNIILLIVVLGLFWFIQLPATKDGMIKTLYEQAMGREIDSIHIFYQKKGDFLAIKHEITLKKVAAHWVMIAPLKAAVDERKIQHLMTLLSDRIEASYPIEGKDLSLFGLDKERVSVVFNGVKIQFGTLNPVTHKRYLRKGDTLYVVAETVYGLLIRGVDGFIVVTPPKETAASE